jgi:hypothetical protein
MDRRQYLAATLSAASLSIAGCSSDNDSSGQSDATTPTPEPDTPTGTPTPAPASFEVDSLTGPDSVGLNESYSLTLEVTNTGGQPGTFEPDMRVRAGNGDWSAVTPPVEMEAGAGETVSKDIEFTAPPYLQSLTYELETTGDQLTFNVVSKTLELGETYTNPDSIALSAGEIDFQPEYTYDSGDYIYTEQPSDGRKFAFLEFSAENTGNNPRPAPLQVDVAMIIGDSQYEPIVYYGEREAYEGGDIQPGIVREGIILYEVPESASKEDVRVVWSESYYDGDASVYWESDD